MHLVVIIHNTCVNSQTRFKVGGAERQAFRLFPLFESLTGRLTIITRYTTYEPRKPTTTVYQIRVPLGFRFSEFLFGLVSAAKLVSAHARNRVDGIQFHVLELFYLPVLLIAKLLRIKTFYIVTSPPTAYFRTRYLPRKNASSTLIKAFSSAVLWKLFVRILHLSDFLQALSPHMKKILVDVHGVKPERVVVIPNGVEVEKLSSLPRGREKAFGVVGTLKEVKNVSCIVEGFARFLRKREERGERGEFELVIVGSGPEEKNLKRLVSQLDVADRVSFLGHRSELGNIYTQFDVFVLASRSEGMSVALLEAMASGKPVVVSRIPSNLHLVKDGVNGLVFDPDDPDELCKQLMRLADERGLKERLGRLAQKTVARNFDIRDVAKNLLKIFYGKPRPPEINGT